MRTISSIVLLLTLIRHNTVSIKRYLVNFVALEKTVPEMTTGCLRKMKCLTHDAISQTSDFLFRTHIVIIGRQWHYNTEKCGSRNKRGCYCHPPDLQLFEQKIMLVFRCNNNHSKLSFDPTPQVYFHQKKVVDITHMIYSVVHFKILQANYIYRNILMLSVV